MSMTVPGLAEVFARRVRAWVAAQGGDPALADLHRGSTARQVARDLVDEVADRYHERRVSRSCSVGVADQSSHRRGVYRLSSGTSGG